MNEDNTVGTVDHWFDSTSMALNESYQLDLRRLLSPDTYELIHSLSDFYLYDPTALLTHLLGLTSHYLTSTSFVYADNQLKHRLNLHLLLIVRSGNWKTKKKKKKQREKQNKRPTYQRRMRVVDFASITHQF